MSAIIGIKQLKHTVHAPMKLKEFSFKQYYVESQTLKVCALNSKIFDLCVIPLELTGLKAKSQFPLSVHYM